MNGIDLEVADQGRAEGFQILARPLGGLSLQQPILRTDIAGMPIEWIDYREAARLYAQVQIAYTCGSPIFSLYGGTNARTGNRSVLEVNSIVATVGNTSNPGNLRKDYVPPLNNQTLFRRDAYLCMYCGHRLAARELSRDHVRPISQGGRDVWMNVVTACRRCNNFKGARTPEQAKMQLLAVPFAPTYAEYIFLKGRRVLVDQMAYLLAHFPRTSPLHERIHKLMS
ncbi:MAG: HNH endonuclease [Gammaproteobacteria bacterium]|nr:HNH endonuclease [Gammaproteobacteria bacterium]